MFKHSQLETVKTWLVSPAHAGMPLHARIQRAIRQLILDGALRPGKPLPASRALAKSLDVSRDTVEAAYSQLHAEGFIERYIGSGSFVAEMSKFLPNRRHFLRDGHLSNPAANLSKRGHVMASDGRLSAQNQARPFAQGIPETRNFPLQLWERIERQTLKEVGTHILLHGDPQGVEPLRRAIADYINLERGARATAEQVLVLTSSQQALGLCAQMLFDPGDRVFIEDPAYYGARRAMQAAGLEVIPVSVDQHGINIDQIMAETRKAKAIFLTPSHQFPTGVTLSLERRLAVIEWAARNKAWIIEDDYDSEFHYEGKPTACVQGLDRYNRTIYVGTFTKSLFPGLRIGYVVLPPQLVEAMTIGRSLFDGHTASISQFTLARFIDGGHFGVHVRAMRNMYAKRRDVLASLIQTHLSDFLEPRIPCGGMQLPCILKGGFFERDIVDAARREGIELMGLSQLYASETRVEGFLMGFAAYAPAEMEYAVQRLKVVLQAQHKINSSLF